MRKAHTIATLVCLIGSAAYTSISAQAQAERGKASPQEHLNRAADAVLKLKSAQFTLTREGAPAFLDEKNGITFTAAQCSYAAPDRVSCNVKISSKSGSILQLTRVWVPEGTFQSNPLTRQFGKAPADSSFNGVVLFARTGIPAILQTSVQKASTGRQRDDSRQEHASSQRRGARRQAEPADGFHAQARGDVSGRSLDGGTIRPIPCGFTSPSPRAMAG